jgi:tetratricopeptide (TPR) repeat protein
MAQVEYKLGNAQNCSMICDRILLQDPANFKAYEMKGDICKHFCLIDQAFFFYSKAISVNPSCSQCNNMSQALSSMGDLYKFQGKMQLAIHHYEKALLSEINRQKEELQVVVASPHQVTQMSDLSGVHFADHSSIASIYSETFMKLFNAKTASCDWSDYQMYQDHLKKIVIKQYQKGQVPCVDPFSLFMLDYSMHDKLIISQKWAEAER